MDHEAFRSWLAQVDVLTSEQRSKLGEVLAEPAPQAAVVAAIEESPRNLRQCPHCQCERSVSRGTSNGLRRFCCTACGKTFNALTGTPLARLRKKDRWLEFGEALSEGDTVKESAERCGVAASTAFRWRHRFLGAAKSEKKPLAGIVEIDETFVLASKKGERKLGRKPRRRGGKAQKRGVSDEQTPVLVAVDRSGTTLTAVLDAVTAKAIHAVLEPVLAKDALLVSDANNVYPPCAKALGVSHEAINLSRGERTRGDLHIQTVNSRHERLKTFLRPRRGIATKYLGSYLNWFQQIGLSKAYSPRECLNAAIGNGLRMTAHG
jgi:transposase-like protein